MGSSRGGERPVAPANLISLADFQQGASHLRAREEELIEIVKARQADIVLSIWKASTDAVFRAFDGYERKRVCYVQGPGFRVSFARWRDG